MTVPDLSRCRLYGILDLSYVEIRESEKMVEAMIAGGVDLIQLRAKGHGRGMGILPMSEEAIGKMPMPHLMKLATDLHRITAERDVPLIINDHPEIARVVPAEGVHLGQDDMAITGARKIVGPDCLVGKSTHSVDQAIRAVYEGADYIGFGPIFATPTKPDYPPIGPSEIQRVHDAVRIPIFCIGGIKLENLPEVLAAGARRVVIVSGLLQARDAAEYARSAKKLLTSRPLTSDL